MYKIYSLYNSKEVGIFINLRNLEVSYYQELLPLSKYLEKYREYDKLIIINVIPIDNISNDILSINKENIEYVEKIFSIINNYKNLNIKVCSTSIRILNALNNFFIHNNCGYYISNDLNYPSCKFYIFPENKYNTIRIDNEINNNNNLVFIFADESYYNQIKNDFNDTSNIYLIKKTL